MSVFDDVFARLKESAEALITANAALPRLAEAVTRARDDHADLRETVERHEAMILGLLQELRELRDRLEGGR